MSIETVYAVDAVNNLHVASIAERADSIIVNVLKCESANAHQLFEADRERITSYLNEMVSYKEWVMNRPRLDLPKSHPTKLNVDWMGKDETRHIQNRSLRDFARLMEGLIKEVTESESAVLACGLQAYDAERFDKIIAQAYALVEFIDGTYPLDKPESSPHAPEVLAGSMNSAPQH